MQEVPDSLLAYQKWLAGLIRRPLRETDALRLPLYEEEIQRQIETWIKEGPFLNARQRIALYQQQYWFRLFVLLQDRYPSLCRLFGYAFFNRHFCEPYLLKYPPGSAALFLEGQTLVKWIESEYTEPDKERIVQLAEIDNAYYLLNFYRAGPSLPSADFDNSEDLVLLQPYVHLFTLKTDLFSFRKELLLYPPSHWKKHPLPPLSEGEKVSYLFYRKNEEAIVESIEAKEKEVLAAFQKGASLKQAFASGPSKAADWLPKWIEKGLLTKG